MTGCVCGNRLCLAFGAVVPRMADMTCELHGCKHVILFMHAVAIIVIYSTNRSGLTRGDLAGITMEHYIIFRINTSICTTS